MHFQLKNIINSLIDKQIFFFDIFLINLDFFCIFHLQMQVKQIKAEKETLSDELKRNKEYYSINPLFSNKLTTVKENSKVAAPSEVKNFNVQMPVSENLYKISFKQQANATVATSSTLKYHSSNANSKYLHGGVEEKQFNNATNNS